MPRLTMKNGLIAFEISGRVGQPTEFGWHTFGWTTFGDYRKWQGQYFRRRIRLNFFEYDSDCYFGAIRFGRERFGSEKLGNVNFSGKTANYIRRRMWPTPTMTETQGIRREMYYMSILDWERLTDEQRTYYNNNKPKKFKRGYDFFRSQWLKS